jgi:trimethylamine:corrinoid methyltransferase-like protein
MHASLLGFCLESVVIDNDIIGAVQRTIRGIDVSDEAISVETIRDVCLKGPGHYLGSDQTLKLMQSVRASKCSWPARQCARRRDSGKLGALHPPP